MRAARVHGISLAGAVADLVVVEARFEKADRERVEVSLSGLPDTVIRESRGRLLAALSANRLRVPGGRLLLNLAPAGLRKAGEALDLPLALGAAAAVGHLTPGAVARALFVGELGVDGRLHPVAGGFAAAEAAARAGLDVLLAPEATAREAACHPTVRVYAIERLADAVAWASGARELPLLEPEPEASDPEEERRRRAITALRRVRGQDEAKHALTVAAAGGHPLLLHGPPGTGKSLLARTLVELLPSPDLDGRIAITRARSAAGLAPRALERRRPFRAPHHTASHAGLIGGGNPPRAGELTLAHQGVLFLDELPEWRREVLEALRQPLEEGRVLLARAGARAELPADVQLVAAMNPCPCGFRGHPQRPCRCSVHEIRRYWHRLSGPFLDRLHLRVELQAPAAGALTYDPRGGEGTAAGDPAAEAPQEVRRIDRVAVARAAARARQGPRVNAGLDAEELARFAPLGDAAADLLARAAEARALSGRALHGVRRVARTLADLAGRDAIEPDDVAEALMLRAPLEPG